MPNQNQSDPNQNQENTPPSVTFSPQADLPPLPPDFQGIQQNEEKEKNQALPSETPPNEGSAAPPIPTFSDITPSPKKKFGTGKIIATILGILILVGGVGTGIVLTQQKQLFQQKASDACCAVGTKQSCSISGAPGTQTCVTSEGEDCVGKINSGRWSTCYPNTTEGSELKCECIINDKESCQTSDGRSGTRTCTTGKACTKGSLNNGTWGGCVPKDIPPGCEPCANNLDVCHCQGGDACTSLLCEPEVHDSCLAQGRSWCKNIYGVGMTCCVKGYVCNTAGNGWGCVPEQNTPNPSQSPSQPPSTPIAPYCAAIKTYDSAWGNLTSTQLSALKTGTTINFCVTGATTSGTFDMARFTVNGTQIANTTTKRPNSEDFCQSYTIPAGVTTFNVSGQIHHSTLGWF